MPWLLKTQDHYKRWWEEGATSCGSATGDEILEVLRELQRSSQQTLVMVTHDACLATLADRRIQLEQLCQPV